MMAEMMYIVASPFKLKGKGTLAVSEFIFTLSLDLKWFSPDQARVVMDRAIRRGLLKQENDSLYPGFDIDRISVPPDFKPDFKKIIEHSVFDTILDRIIIATGAERKVVASEINRRYEKYGEIIDINVVALIVAKEKDAEIADLIEEVSARLFG